jgi:hypothetical protein
MEKYISNSSNLLQRADQLYRFTVHAVALIHSAPRTRVSTALGCRMTCRDLRAAEPNNMRHGLAAIQPSQVQCAHALAGVHERPTSSPICPLLPNECFFKMVLCTFRIKIEDS